MPLEIDYSTLTDAMGRYDPLDEILYYFDTQTGDVLQIDASTEQQARKLHSPDETDDPALRLAWHVLWYDGESVGEALSEAEETAMYERVEAFLERYEPVPTADSEESYQDMVDFAATVSDPRLRGRLEGALVGNGAFRRFREALDSDYEECQRWFEFKDRQLRRRVDEWLQTFRRDP